MTISKFILLLLFSTVSAFGQLNSYTLTFTNATANGNSVTVSGSTAQFTNIPLNSVSWITSGSSNVSATNFFLWMGRNKSVYGATLTSSNVVTFRGLSLAATVSGSFGYITTNAQTITNSFNLIPWDNLSETNRTNNANEFIYGLNKYVTTNRIDEGAKALSNYVSLTYTQTVANKIVTNATIQGGSISNSILTNIARANIGQAIVTNATIHGGNATNLNLTSATGDFRNGYFSNVIGHSVTITNLSADTVSVMANPVSGYATIALDNYWNIAGNSGGDLFIENIDNGDVPVRFSSSSGGGTVFTLPVTVSNSITVTGALSAASATISGPISGTNYTVGRGSNYWHGDLSVTPNVYTGLGNGDNYNLPFGTNASVYASGATTVMKMHSIPAGRSYQRLRVRLSGAVTNWIVNESLGEGTVTERCTTGTGGDIFSTNQPSWAEFEYTGSRWEVVSFR